MQPFLHAGVSLLDWNDELLLESAFFPQQVRLQKTELRPQIFEGVLDRRSGQCDPVFALQLDD